MAFWAFLPMALQMLQGMQSQGPSPSLGGTQPTNYSGGMRLPYLGFGNPSNVQPGLFGVPGLRLAGTGATTKERIRSFLDPGSVFGRREPKRAGHVARTMTWVSGCESFGIGSPQCPVATVQRQLSNMASRPHYAEPYQRLLSLVQYGGAPAYSAPRYPSPYGVAHW